MSIIDRSGPDGPKFTEFGVYITRETSETIYDFSGFPARTI